MTKESLIKELVQDGYLKSPCLIEAFEKIDRADFVREEYKSGAYENHPLPIGERQTISQPLTVAFMLELLNPQKGEKILDVGSGSGWTTALLAYLVGKNGKVFAMETVPKLCKFGEKNIRKYSFIEKGAVGVFCQDATKGLPEHAPFDKILAGAAAHNEVPTTWREQLKIEGRIVAPIKSSVWLLIKKSETEWKEKEFPGFVFVPLVKS